MTFTPANPKIPTSIGGIEINLYSNGGTNEANYRVHIMDQDGSEMRTKNDIGNLVPHLTQSDITWLLDFMARIRTKATEEFIG